MGLFDFNPVSWAESAVTAGLERDVAEQAMSDGYSFFLTLLCSLRSIPIIGNPLAQAGMSIYLNRIRGGLKNKLQLTVPDWYNDPNNQANFVTEKGK